MGIEARSNGSGGGDRRSAIGSPARNGRRVRDPANGGIDHEPTVIGWVEFPSGKVDEPSPDLGDRVLTEGEAYEVTKLLEGVITQGTGAGYTYMGCGAEAEDGHLGGSLDAWFVGYTPLYSTAVWVGDPIARIDRLRRADRRADLALLHGIGGGRQLPEFAEPAKLPNSPASTADIPAALRAPRRSRRRTRSGRRRRRRSQEGSRKGEGGEGGGSRSRPEAAPARCCPGPPPSGGGSPPARSRPAVDVSSAHRTPVAIRTGGWRGGATRRSAPAASRRCSRCRAGRAGGPLRRRPGRDRHLLDPRRLLRLRAALGPRRLDGGIDRLPRGGVGSGSSPARGC